MAWADWAILAVLTISTLGGMSQGFFRSACSLAGLSIGIVLAVWNYARVAVMFKPIVHVEALADAIGFLLIALAVMALANVTGVILQRMLQWMGLGCLDMLGGAVFGFLQGGLLVMLCVLVTVAFIPQAHWLADARLPKHFFGVCHASACMSPGELADRVRDGLRLLEDESPGWIRSN